MIPVRFPETVRVTTTTTVTLGDDDEMSDFQQGSSSSSSSRKSRNQHFLLLPVKVVALGRLSAATVSFLSFLLLIILLPQASSLSLSSSPSFYHQKFPVLHLDDDIVEVYEITPESSEIRHVDLPGFSHRRPPPHYPPEVEHVLAMLLTPPREPTRHPEPPRRIFRRPRRAHYRKKFRAATEKWPDGVIPFVIDRPLRRYQRLIFNAMREIESRSCISFREREDEQDFIVLRAGSGCFSSVGKKGGMQIVSLGRGCANYGIILHELMHVVGFYHLHQRHDRDKFLDIHWENINPLFMNNFKLLGPEHIPMDERFDYHSIMMYGDTSFSRDSHSITMTPTFGGVQLLDPAYKTGLSDIDVRSINRMYNCEDNNHINNFVDYD